MTRLMARWILLFGLLAVPAGCSGPSGQEQADQGRAEQESVVPNSDPVDPHPRLTEQYPAEVQEQAFETPGPQETQPAAESAAEVRSFAVESQRSQMRLSPQRLQVPTDPLHGVQPPLQPEGTTPLVRQSFQDPGRMMPRSVPLDGVPEAVNAQAAESELAGTVPMDAMDAESAAPETTAAPTGNVDPSTGDLSTGDPDYQVVEVFYGTDREPVEAMASAGTIPVSKEYFPALGLAAIALLALTASLVLVRRRGLLAAVGVLCLLGAAALGVQTSLNLAGAKLAHAEKGRVYGNGRGELEVGTCQVSIPRVHQVGRLESPSILRLEIREDARKHVMLRKVTPQARDDFYARLRERVAESSQKDLFVFVHGYNVTFEDAARRTAQIAYDLKFPGAAVFFSWPSQGGLLKYKVDESNVQWTVPHLKQFLLEVAENSGASAVNLVAHSMGNRALTDALRQLRYEMREEVLFHQVVLAAPDIDADVFRRDIAPAIRPTARRVTLYASSDDQALIASKNVHGYPRAGDSGSGLVVIPGVETIDVSGIDTSLLGHSYYGSSHSILADLYEVIRRAQPPSARQWLHPKKWEGLIYWRLQPENDKVAQPNGDTQQY